MAQAAPTQAMPAQPEPSAATGALGIGGAAKQPEPAPTEPAKRPPAHYLWAVLIARIYEVFPLVCPSCAGQMRIIVFITDGKEVCKILEHIGVDFQAPRITPARGPPLWDDCDAQASEGVDAEPESESDASIQIAPDYEADQRINW